MATAAVATARRGDSVWCFMKAFGVCGTVRGAPDCVWLLTVCVSCPQAWLQRYGYLPSVDPRMSVLRSARVMQSAIAAMQRRYGLNVTGTLDSNTIE